MSLLKKKSSLLEEREPLTTKSAVIEEQREQTREYQKQQRAKYADYWKAEKSVIDGIGGNELNDYIVEHVANMADNRCGIHSMKINPYELAIIKKAMEIEGSRSSRELFINYCKSIVKGNTKSNDDK
ncbi:hypothetical protein GLP30_20655 [Photobacterium phosphoreum]|uniref:Uncharacterized protein n=1 Tax=Photobacterium phosphoreum TaxID=659 RepID=A0AAW5A691_PHOPO|nr:hypothetical protein [Photobacterium phosphoreum]MCD9493189.1 hypothetical protein [Photobacterium phosphoreum]MCF2192460.1 hypothetical protein [Photobacterium phosphoreum]MCF2304106.1 hypothetical protein [Photobacterium phosphoreum]